MSNPYANLPRKKGLFMVNDAITIVIIGATGDLAKRKIIPALYQLFLQGRSFIIMGFALEDRTADQILHDARPFIEGSADRWHEFCQHFFYAQLDVGKTQDFQRAYDGIIAKEKEYNCSGKRCIYLATAAFLYASITQHLFKSGIAVKKEKQDPVWHRIAYEKPFGHDAQSAHAINETISHCFNEHQIYRIDHYLTKQLVSNILIIRFTNCVFEPLWNNRYIDQVHITLNETIDIESRGSYYDHYGALKDVVQNHMLQMLALMAMESPAILIGDEIRDKRIALLKHVVCVDGIRGQYQGYLDEYGVSKHSNTETFATLLMYINNHRWKGVPFFFTTGKCLDKKEVSIKIKFKQVDCLLAKNCSLLTSNWLNFTISPQELFSLQLNIKKPGTSDVIIPATMNFPHGDMFAARSSHAYETVMTEIFEGEQTSCIRFDEIEQSWRIIDEIEKRNFELYVYDKNTSGPVETQQFIRKWGMKVH